MAVSKTFVVLALFFTFMYLANSAPFGNSPMDQTEMMNPNEETDVKEPEQYGGGYNSGRCRYGCCYKGSYGCIRCCHSPNEETNSVDQMQQRGGCRHGCCGSYVHGHCTKCCRSQVAEEAKP